MLHCVNGFWVMLVVVLPPSLFFTGVIIIVTKHQSEISLVIVLLRITWYNSECKSVNKELLGLLTPVAACHTVGHFMSNVSFAAVAVSFTHTIKGCCFMIPISVLEQKDHQRLQEEKSMRMVLERAMGRASSTLSPGHRH
ncbi:hypothetical protein POM88_042333 [Heracleum sosnowskyi]|uniref:Sugar phosphate transporter domain-containing protein n=1 Tax=Heracleum sosnowskyi TaxID=360622 RepID=A0AAD8HG06_9APIA|nr:hypothetical protein POM88_042333 [Heracleum sosnowskyi]